MRIPSSLELGILSRITLLASGSNEVAAATLGIAAAAVGFIASSPRAK